jgi:riboflavin synthase alpha subunit
MTTMGFKKLGDTVNLEPDILAKYVARFLQTDKDSSLLSALKKSGFIS